MGLNSFKLTIGNTSKVIGVTIEPTITNSCWIGLEGNDIPVNDEGVQDIFYGEKVKIKIIAEGASDETEFEIQIKAADGSIVIEENDKQPLIHYSKSY